MSDPVIQGKACDYETPTNGQLLQRGCFKRWLANPYNEVELWTSHHTDSVVGFRSTGALELFDTHDALFFRFTPPDTARGRSVRSTNYRGASVGFHYNPGRRVENGVTIVDEARLEEISLTHYPAQSGALIGFVQPTFSLVYDVTTMACDRAANDFSRALKELAEAVARKSP